MGYISDFSESEEEKDINFVTGDATKPIRRKGPCIIIKYETSSLFCYHFIYFIWFSCLDDSGNWGRGGFFWAIAKLSPLPQSSYETAAEMDDIHLGDAHLVQIDDNSTFIFLFFFLLLLIYFSNSLRREPDSSKERQERKHQRIARPSFRTCSSKSCSIRQNYSWYYSFSFSPFLLYLIYSPPRVYSYAAYWSWNARILHCRTLDPQNPRCETTGRICVSYSFSFFFLFLFISFNFFPLFELL